MNPAEWQRLKAILQTALDLPDSERPDYLDRACAGDADLRREIEAYLRYENAPGAAFGITAWRETEEAAIADPDRAGPYRILRRIGEGGMGVVYLAERDDDTYRQQVAVKVMKAGSLDAHLVRRFRNERQILAELNHAYIARMIDGGTTAAGQLYYAMEYVEGQPVTDYCNLRRHGIRERVGLFSKICMAVVDAHRKLIVHGDLKPANILVAGDGNPKVVDFGLAMVFREEDGRNTSNASTLIMTPGYASPEQIAGRRPTAAVDVYSLGVLLCELLTGYSPYALEGKTPFEACRAALEDDPQAPSAILKARKANPAIPIMARQLKGDLDSIVLKALRKEPEQRYGSVEELREEIERYLAGLPVRASNGARLYRFRKIVRRRRWAFAAAAVVAIGAAAATSVIWWQGRLAERRFNDVRELAHAVIFEVHDSVQDLPGSTAARKLLVERALQYLRKLEADGGVRRDLQLELAAAYLKIGEVQSDNAVSSLGDTSGALTSLKDAHRLLSAALPASPLDSRVLEMLLDVDLKLADVEEQRGDASGMAAARLEAARFAGTLSQIHPESRRFQASVAHIQASGLSSGGDWNAALPAWKAAAGADRLALDQEPADDRLRGNLAESYDGVADACKQLKQWDCAISYYRQACAIRRDELASAPANTRFAMLLAYHLIDLSWVEHMAGMQAQAIADEDRAFQLQRKIADEDPQNLMARLETAKTMVTRGLIYRDNGETPAAIASLSEAIRLFEALIERDPRNQSTLFHLAWSSAELGAIYRNRALAQRRPADARPDWREAAASFERSKGYLDSLQMSGRFLGIFDLEQLRKWVPESLAESRSHLR